MKLVVRDVAALFGVPEKSVYRWISGQKMPAHRINDQYRFNRIELLEWATANRVPLPVEILSAVEQPGFSGLREALESGGIHYLAQIKDRASLLSGLVGPLPLPDPENRSHLAEVLSARESMGLTGIGNGVAIPHARNPMVFRVKKPLAALYFFDTPVPFDSRDGLPVHTLFIIASPTVNGHLNLLSRLSFALQEDGFKTAVSERAGSEKILFEADRIDSMIKSLPPEKEED